MLGLPVDVGEDETTYFGSSYEKYDCYDQKGTWWSQDGQKRCKKSSEHTEDNKRTTHGENSYFLDSAASPSFITNLPQDANHKPTDAPVHTVNGDAVATEKGRVSLMKEASPTIIISDIGMPKLRTNLLCVSDIVCKQRSLIFTPESAYRLPMKLFTILNLRKSGKVEEWSLRDKS